MTRCSTMKASVGTNPAATTIRIRPSRQWARRARSAAATR